MLLKCVLRVRARSDWRNESVGTVGSYCGGRILLYRKDWIVGEWAADIHWVI